MRICFRFLLLGILLLAACNREESSPPPLNREAPAPAAFDLLGELKMMAIPPRDLRELTQRLTDRGPIPEMVAQSGAPYQVGDIVTFWYKDQDSGTNIEVAAELHYQSDELYMWFEDGVRVRQADLAETTQFLETRLLPTHRAFFGRESSPGIDGDKRIHILHLEEIGGIVAAYYSSADGYAQAVNPYSNEREILYISMKSRELASDDYYGSVAQEMQHLIQQNTDPNESAWLNEGMSELSLHLNDIPPGREAEYADRTDTQLNNLAYDPDTIGAHYAAAFLFTNYFREQFGETATQALNQNAANGLQGFDNVLAALATGLTADQFFANWLVANYLTSIERPTAPYLYETVEIPTIGLANDHRRYPVEAWGGVSQYGADYIRFRGDEPLQLTFTGSQRVKLFASEAHSGSGVWSTVPADKSDVMLTGRFDLSDVDSATLSFWTWYEIEAGWDYAYLSVSTDDGASWALLETAAATRDNPQGNSLGPGYTGNSGGGDNPIWIEQEADLTAFVGGEILLRFEYVTDDAIHLAGFALDDLTIDEIGFADEMEDRDPVWNAQGFIRHDNHLPQRYILQVIYLGDDVRVETLDLADDQSGSWTLNLNDRADEAILIVAATTPVTTLPAGYQYSATE